jgi:tRNA A-37 threonylcarbamoyl transferase component Bud32
MPDRPTLTGRQTPRDGADRAAERVRATAEETLPLPSAQGSSAVSQAGAGSSTGVTTAETLPGEAAPRRPTGHGGSDLLGADPLIGTTLLARYRVTRRIGQGGVGAVYEGQHLLIGKRVAIKVLLDKYQHSQPVVARLRQEARLASSIGHEHIVDITDFGETDDGRTFVVMEYLEGESLGARIARRGRLEPSLVIDIGLQIAGALAAAHGKGIVHRDVKPDNIFLLRRHERDFVKVVDFGLSKSLAESSIASLRLTQTGMMLGTPLYMAPEQVNGEEVDHRTDIYALGVILYEMCTGTVPFPGRNFTSVVSRIAHEEPRPPRELNPALGEELQAIILCALRKSRDERYASMQALAAHLEALQRDPLSSGARSQLRAVEPPRRAGHGRWLRRGGALLLAGGIGAAGAAVLDELVSRPGPRAVPTAAGLRRASRAAPAGAASTGRSAGAATADLPAGAAPSPAVSRAPAAAPVGDPALAGALSAGPAAISAPAQSGAAAARAGLATPAGGASGANPGLVQPPAAAPGAPAVEPGAGVPGGAAGQSGAGGGAAAAVATARELASGDAAETATVAVEIGSEPPGAVVFAGGRPLGRAPLRLELPRRARPVVYTARLRGHRSRSVTVDPAQQTSYTVHLPPLPSPGAVPAARAPGPAAAPGVPAAAPGVPAPPGAAELDDTAGGDLTGNPYE